MAKKKNEEPKYNCSDKIDGTKAYYYFNPPHPEEAKKRIFDGIKDLVIGVCIIALAIVAKLKVTFIDPVSILDKFVIALIVVGALFLLAGALIIRKAIKKKAELEAKIVSDEEHDSMEAVMLQDIMEKGMKCLNLDADEITEADPLVLHRYTNGGDSRKGKDGVYRSTEHVSTVFFFTEDSLFVYKYNFSMKNKVTSEETVTLFYKDIVSVVVGAVDAKLGEEETIGLRELSISSSGGQTFAYQFIASEEINVSIQAMQSLFRNKKRA